MEFYLDTTIQELYEHKLISVRTYHSLALGGYDTLDKILGSITSPYDLMKIPKFGRKSCWEVEPILNQVKRIYRPVVHENKETVFSALGEPFVSIITNAYRMVTDGDSAVKYYLRETYPHPSDMHFLVLDDLNKMLIVIEKFSREENLEIRHTYKNFMDHVVERIEFIHEVNDNTYTLYEQNSTELSMRLENFRTLYKQKSMEFAMRMEDFSYKQIASNFLSPIAHKYLEQTYRDLVESCLSVRGKKYVNTCFSHYIDILQPSETFQALFTGKKKTLSEFIQLNQKFIKIFDRVSKLSDDDIQLECLKRNYPFLVNKQRQFVFDFMKEHHHAPLFYLTLNYLRLSENRTNKIYCLLHGIYDGEKKTIREIGNTMNLTGSRVGQIAKNGIDLQISPIADNDDWGYYKEIFDIPFVYEGTKEYIRIKETEKLSIGFEQFASLLSALTNYKAEVIEGHTILVNKNIINVNLSERLENLRNMANAKYAANTYVPIDSLLSTIPYKVRAIVKELFIFIITRIYNITFTKNEQLYFPQNHLDIGMEIYDILDKKGKPMHIEEIFYEFKKRYPEHKYTDPLQIKIYCYRHEHIKAVGKTSCYALDSWKGVYFGNIRDLLVDLLNESEVPLHIDYLYDRVSKHFPNTSKASITSSLADETFQRFVEFEGGYYGLTSKDYPADYVEAPSVQRYRFEDRFQMFKNFVDTYHRFPSYNGSEEEASLMRWFYNVTKGGLVLTDNQAIRLDKTLTHYDKLGYPRTSIEYEFLMNCQKMKEYICQYHALPTNNRASELFAWFRRSRDNYNSFTDKRREYMTDLLKYILALGFGV